MSKKVTETKHTNAKNDVPRDPKVETSSAGESDALDSDKLHRLGPSESGSIVPSAEPAAAKSLRSETSSWARKIPSVETQTAHLFDEIKKMRMEAQVAEVTRQFQSYRKRSVEDSLRSCFILHCADQLAPKAKADVMVKLRMKKSYFSKLQTIGRNFTRLTAISDHLPSSYTALGAIAGLTDLQIEWAIRKGIIHPNVTEAEVDAAFPHLLMAKKGTPGLTAHHAPAKKRSAPKGRTIDKRGSLSTGLDVGQVATGSEDDHGLLRQEQVPAQISSINLTLFAELYIPATGVERRTMAIMKGALEKVIADCGGEIKFFDV
jgi:hypothetical protein